MLPMSFKVLDPTLNQFSLFTLKCGLHVCPICILSLVSFHYLGQNSIFQNSCFLLLLKAQLHHSHISHSLLPSFGSKPNFIFFFSFSFFFPPFFFFFGLWIQLEDTYLALTSSFGLKHKLFMNFARLVHILCSIRPYKNGLIKEFKYKNQCPIYNASPTYFWKISFLMKNLFELVFEISHDT